MLCSLEHGSKDQGKDGVCLLPPAFNLSGSWSSGWYCPDQGARSYSRKQWKRLAGASQAQCFSHFVQALLVEWSNSDWCRAMPSSLMQQSLRAGIAEFISKQSKTQGRSKREVKKTQGRVSPSSKDHQARQRLQFWSLHLLKGLW